MPCGKRVLQKMERKGLIGKACEDEFGTLLLAQLFARKAADLQQCAVVIPGVGPYGIELSAFLNTGPEIGASIDVRPRACKEKVDVVLPRARCIRGIGPLEFDVRVPEAVDAIGPVRGIRGTVLQFGGDIRHSKDPIRVEHIVQQVGAGDRVVTGDRRPCAVVDGAGFLTLGRVRGKTDRRGFVSYPRFCPELVERRPVASDRASVWPGE